MGDSLSGLVFFLVTKVLLMGFLKLTQTVSCFNLETSGRYSQSIQCFLQLFLDLTEVLFPKSCMFLLQVVQEEQQN